MASGQVVRIVESLMRNPDLAWETAMALVEKNLVGPWHINSDLLCRKTPQEIIIGHIANRGSFYKWHVSHKSGAPSKSGQASSLKDAILLVDKTLRDSFVLVSEPPRLIEMWANPVEGNPLWALKDIMTGDRVASIESRFVGDTLWYETVFHPDINKVGWTLQSWEESLDLAVLTVTKKGWAVLPKKLGDYSEHSGP